MSRGYLYLSILLTLLLVVRVYITTSYHLPTLTPLLISNDPESKLARGEMLRFSKITPLALELLPGISTTLADAIYSKKEEILRHAKSLEPHEQYKAFEIVHGIGPKTAQKLSQYLALEPQAKFPYPP